MGHNLQDRLRLDDLSDHEEPARTSGAHVLCVPVRAWVRDPRAVEGVLSDLIIQRHKRQEEIVVRRKAQWLLEQ